MNPKAPQNSPIISRCDSPKREQPGGDEVHAWHNENWQQLARKQRVLRPQRKTHEYYLAYLEENKKKTPIEKQHRHEIVQKVSITNIEFSTKVSKDDEKKPANELKSSFGKVKTRKRETYHTDFYPQLVLNKGKKCTVRESNHTDVHSELLQNKGKKCTVKKPTYCPSKEIFKKTDIIEKELARIKKQFASNSERMKSARKSLNTFKNKDRKLLETKEFRNETGYLSDTEHLLLEENARLTDQLYKRREHLAEHELDVLKKYTNIDIQNFLAKSKERTSSAREKQQELLKKHITISKVKENAKDAILNSTKIINKLDEVNAILENMEFSDFKPKIDENFFPKKKNAFTVNNKKKKDDRFKIRSVASKFKSIDDLQDSTISVPIDLVPSRLTTENSEYSIETQPFIERVNMESEIQTKYENSYNDSIVRNDSCYDYRCPGSKYFQLNQIDEHEIYEIKPEHNFEFQTDFPTIPKVNEQLTKANHFEIDKNEFLTKCLDRPELFESDEENIIITENNQNEDCLSNEKPIAIKSSNSLCISTPENRYFMKGNTIYTSSGLMISTIFPNTQKVTEEEGTPLTPVTHSNELENTQEHLITHEKHPESKEKSFHPCHRIIKSMIKNLQKNASEDLLPHQKCSPNVEAYLKKHNQKEPKAYTEVFEQLQDCFHEQLQQSQVLKYNQEEEVNTPQTSPTHKSGNVCPCNTVESASNTDTINNYLTPRSSTLLDRDLGGIEGMDESAYGCPNTSDEIKTNLQSEFKVQHMDIYRDVIHSQFLQKEMNFEPDPIFHEIEKEAKMKMKQNDVEENDWESVTTSDDDFQLQPQIQHAKSPTLTQRTNEKIQIPNTRMYHDSLETLKEYVENKDMEKSPRKRPKKDACTADLVKKNVELMRENKMLLQQLNQVKNRPQSSRKHSSLNISKHLLDKFPRAKLLTNRDKMNQIHNRVNQVIDQLEHSNEDIISILNVGKTQQPPTPRRKRNPLIGVYNKMLEIPKNPQDFGSILITLPASHKTRGRIIKKFKSKTELESTDYFKQSVDFMKNSVQTIKELNPDACMDLDNAKKPKNLLQTSSKSTTAIGRNVDRNASKFKKDISQSSCSSLSDIPKRFYVTKKTLDGDAFFQKKNSVNKQSPTRLDYNSSNSSAEFGMKNTSYLFK